MTETIERARSLAPLLQKRAQEIAEARTLPLDIVAELVAAGCFRMFVPASHGGDELPLSEGLQVIEEVSRADGATGWTVMIGSSAPAMFSYFPTLTFDEIYAGGPDVIGAGALAPRPMAVEVDGGYEVTGQWPFASGCRHSAWLVVHAVVVEDSKPKQERTGAPVMRAMLFPRAEVEIVDTWHVVGLEGTGSDDLKLSQAFCPTERAAPFFGATPPLRWSLHDVPFPSQLGLYVSSVAVGVAQGALDGIAALAASGKKGALSATTLAKSQVFQDRLGEADADLRAARALLYSATEQAYAKAAHEGMTILDRVRLRATGAKVVSLSVSAVDAAHFLAGGTSVYESSPLARRLRDIHTITQHAATARDFYSLVGATLAGEEVESHRI